MPVNIGGLGSTIATGGGKGGGTVIVGEGADSEKGFTVDTRNGKLGGRKPGGFEGGGTKLPNKPAPVAWRCAGNEPNAGGTLGEVPKVKLPVVGAGCEKP